jgi:hypothetical protein
VRPAAEASPPGPRLPRAVRLAALLCFVLASLTLLSSLQDLTVLAHLEQLRDELARPGAAAARPTRFNLDPELQRRALQTQLDALEPLRTSRAVVLVGLAGACFLIIGASGHLMRRAGVLPREGMRLLLGRAALVAAVLRTVEGAQSAVVWRRLGPVLVENTPGAEALREVAPTAFAASAMVFTALVVGLYLALAQYFRSERVRQLVAAQEPQLGRDA